MTLRETLEHARELAKSEYQVAGRKLAKSPSKTKLGEIQLAVKAIAEQLARQPNMPVCRVHSIESICLYRWDDEQFIALAEGNLVSVYRAVKTRNSNRPRSPQAVINIKSTDLSNIDQYFGPLIDMDGGTR